MDGFSNNEFQVLIWFVYVPLKGHVIAFSLSDIKVAGRCADDGQQQIASITLPAKDPERNALAFFPRLVF